MRRRGRKDQAGLRAARLASISAPIALDRRRAELGYDALQELEQQFQVPMSGTANSAGAYAVSELEFEVEFFDAPEQRDSSLAVPHFTYGAFLSVGTIQVSANVTEWVQDDRGAIIGASVTIGVCTPGVDLDLVYEGYCHLTFQGFGAISENSSLTDVGV